MILPGLHGTGSAPDPHMLRSFVGTNVITTNTDGRVLRHPGPIAGERLATPLLFGQSQVVNSVNEFYAPVHGDRIENVNIYDGAIYAAEEPLLGCGEQTTIANRGNMGLRFADQLISGDYYDRVRLVPFAIGAETIAEWIPGGSRHHRIGVTASRLNALGLSPTMIIFHLGESDNIHNTTYAQWVERWGVLESVLRSYWPRPIPIFVCQTSWIQGGTAAAITAAQAAVVDPARDVYAGANTDLIGSVHRYDNTHFKASGRDLFVSAQVVKFVEWLNG